jgi:hypothetical protein
MMRHFAVVLLTAGVAAALCTLDSFGAAARSCSDQNGICVSVCTAYGIGRGRKSDPHPRSAEFCRHHCAAWYAGCLKTGCWNGDLAKMCGLSKG